MKVKGTLFETFVHKCHWATHCSYLALVFVESHGYYGIAAGAMLVLVLIIKALEIFEGSVQ